MTKPSETTKVNYAQVHREAVRLAHQFRNLITFAEQVGEIAAWESTSAEIKQQLGQLQGEEAAARARIDTARAEATSIVETARAKAAALVADAERRAQRIAADAEAAAARLSKDTAALAAAQAQLGQVRGELEAIRSRFN
jgi:hypothetical protein